MAFCELNYFSKSLQKMTAANIILPEERSETRFPVFYLLHGLSDNHTAWQRYTSIERYVRHLPLIVVMPDGGRGFYADAEQGMNWESAIIEDLIPYIDRMFNTKSERKGRCIGGLSMGGFGAVKLALKHPELFCSAVSHSGALSFVQRLFEPPSSPEFEEEFARVVGRYPIGGPNDLYALAAKLDPVLRPALRIDCGVADRLLPQNRDYITHLNSIDYAHEYVEYPGAHNWDYWDVHVQEAIVFHMRNMEK